LKESGWEGKMSFKNGNVCERARCLFQFADLFSQKIIFFLSYFVFMDVFVLVNP